MVVVGAAAILGGCIGLWFATTESKTYSSAITLLVLCVTSVVFGAYCILSAVRSCVVLSADRIEDRGVLWTRELARHQILGRRFQQGRNAPGSLVLIPRDDGRKIKIPQVLKTDAAFEQWIESLPDLDAQDLKASEEEIAGGAEGSSLREGRLDELANGRKLATWLKAATYVIAGWGWIYPQPYDLVVTLLILLPWLAVVIVARSDGIFRIDQRRNDAHPSVGVLFLMPGLVLTMRVLNDMHVVAWKPALYLAIGIGLLLWMAAAKVDASLRTRPATLVLAFLITLAYGYGAGLEINQLLDHSAATVYSGRVMGKHISSGSKHTNYDLEVNSPDLDAFNGNLSVPSSLYHSVAVGDSICATVKRGALNIQWFVVHRCE